MTFRLPKSKKGKLFLSLTVFLIFLFVFFGNLFYKGVKEGPAVNSVVTSFLQNVSSGEFETAYSQTSEEFKKKVPQDDLEFLASENPAQYKGFKSLNQTGFKVNKNAGEPTVYTFFGDITYDNGDKGTVDAKLVKENSEYKILYIYVDVDLDRAKEFSQKKKNSVLGASTE